MRSVSVHVEDPDPPAEENSGACRVVRADKASCPYCPISSSKILCSQCRRGLEHHTVSCHFPAPPDISAQRGNAGLPQARLPRLMPGQGRCRPASRPRLPWQYTLDVLVIIEISPYVCLCFPMYVPGGIGRVVLQVTIYFIGECSDRRRKGRSTACCLNRCLLQIGIVCTTRFDPGKTGTRNGRERRTIRGFYSR